MSLLQDYCMTYNADKSYTLDFNTTAPASVTYTTGRDGSNVITINTSKKGNTSFSRTFTSVNDQFKFVFDQPDATARRIRIPNGSMQP
ncbi:MAG: hypothetical protein ACPGU9_02375 [Flavobacteriaceae bacterium]